MKHQKKIALLILGAIGLAGCGVTDGASNTRAITGTVAASQANSLQALAADTCAADKVIATDTAGTATTTDVADDCSFQLTVDTGKSYAIGFTRNDSFVATVVFSSGTAGFSGSDFAVSPGDTPIALGTITISGSTAVPASNPLNQTDQDGDGVADLDDTDDDEDGIEDEMEGDCDLDGVLDDFDESSDCDEAPEGMARVLEVKPRNDPHPDKGEDRIDLDKDVRARISCEVDHATVTSETYAVISENGLDVVSCQYNFSGTGKSGNRIKCEHETDFLPDTIYTATIDGVLCANGTVVESRSWSWLTETEEDDEEGDGEEELDDEEEAGEEEEDDDDEEENTD